MGSPATSVAHFLGRRSRLAVLAVAAVTVAALLGAVGGFGGAEQADRAAEPSAKADAPTTAAAPAGGEVAYGLAEPATALPGASTPDDIAAWDRLRADVAASGACWLRSDLNEWLTGAIDALPWLGSPAPCGSGPAAPVKLLAILDDQTVWAARRVCPDTEFSAAYRRHHAGFTLDDWGRLVGCIAQRYRGRISAYEIWNEPLLGNSQFGYEDGTAAHYADLLRVACGAIKAADPDALVVALGGSDAYSGGDATRLARMHDFTTQLVALGARRYADAISLHAYPFGRTDTTVFASYEAELRSQSKAWGLPVWVTETGTRVSDAGTQSSYAEAAYDVLVRSGASAVFWFSITDQREGSYGVRGRPIESTLRSFASAHRLAVAGTTRS